MAEQMGFCNKCGYHGMCKVLANGVLEHVRTTGKVCSYSAVADQRLSHEQAVEALWEWCQAKSAAAPVEEFKKGVARLLREAEQRGRLSAVRPMLN